MEDSSIIIKFWINHQPPPAPKQKSQRKRTQDEKNIRKTEDEGPKLVFLVMLFGSNTCLRWFGHPGEEGRKMLRAAFL